MNCMKTKPGKTFFVGCINCNFIKRAFIEVIWGRDGLCGWAAVSWSQSQTCSAGDKAAKQEEDQIQLYLFTGPCYLGMYCVCISKLMSSPFIVFPLALHSFDSSHILLTTISSSLSVIIPALWHLIFIGWGVIGTAGKEASGVIVAFLTYQLVIYPFPTETKGRTKCHPTWVWPNIVCKLKLRTSFLRQGQQGWELAHRHLSWYRAGQ